MQKSFRRGTLPGILFREYTLLRNKTSATHATGAFQDGGDFSPRERGVHSVIKDRSALSVNSAVKSRFIWFSPKLKCTPMQLAQRLEQTLSNYTKIAQNAILIGFESLFMV